ncbi:hypothetical protein BJX70DRAFT_379619 [Aspergillus crustosus]
MLGQSTYLSILSSPLPPGPVVTSADPILSLIILLLPLLFLLLRLPPLSKKTTADIMQKPGQTLLVFGPQALSLDKRAANKLREDIDNSNHRAGIHETIAGLPVLWTALCTALPALAGMLPGLDRLQDLENVLQSGADDASDDLFSYNIILTPLVVLIQLMDYGRYLATECEQNEGTSGPQTRQIENGNTAIGFCTGLLSTFAVASSHTTEDLAKYGAVAVRLAMLIGALVDAEETRQEALGNGRSVSYSVAWNSKEQEAKLHEILGRSHPEVYIAVQYDRSRATLTSSRRVAASVTQELREAGLTAAEVQLQGRFHDPSAERVQDTDKLVELCDQLPELQFAASPALTLASYTNTNGGKPTTDESKLHELAVRSMLVNHCDWYGTFTAFQASSSPSPERVVCFGSEKCIPPTWVSQVQPVYQNSKVQSQQNKQPQSVPQNFPNVKEDDLIAVVGMAIKTAGADDTDEFAQMLRTGKPQHQAIKQEDIAFDTPWRDNTTSRTWYCNYIRDRSEFDHSFFRVSPREAAAMDPQHRLFLQAAYQATEQSGYFARPRVPEDPVGVFVGISTTDYDQHVSCYDPNAYTSTGNLRAFLAGKVSHQFGWTGPAMTIDTACSSSAVAVHLACRSILSGECSSAIAGGVATMSSPFWFQNLASASFLSPTGQCKPFDEKGDGYCRAEGIGCVMLKKMKDAVADNDQILGCIAASAVHQNQNCTALVAPNKPSLSTLFRQVVAKSGVTPGDISVVEAHGTGTAVGDPAEYGSIYQALDVTSRSKPLFLGSAKGHIGHTEAAAGVVSLIKVLMMMNEGFIPPQASHTRLSPRISPSSEMMHISKELRSWDTSRKAALVNSYGASGSNTSMVLIQPPKPATASRPAASFDGIAFPFWLPGLDDTRISAYCARLGEYIRARPSLRLADLSFNLSRQSNRSLAKQLIFTSRSMSELQSTLSRFASSAEDSSQDVPAERPVILCFGGQVSTFVGLDRAVYDQVDALRHYLDQCDSVMTSMGLESIYPDIFSREPIQDTVKLQSMLFAIQYSCARSWMKSGLSGKVTAVVGHSFGELTALCVSGILSIQDAVKLVAGRARLIRDEWGSDKGAMVAVEADESVVHEVLQEARSASPTEEHPASIACYNGPRSFTLAGSTTAIQGVIETIRSKFSSLRHKQLNVTNSFHCSLTDGLVEPLTKLGDDLTFNSPTIHIEHSTALPPTGARLASNFVANHLRNPVYFNQAVQRLAKAYPDSIWLEAGSNSTITTMASRALRSTSVATTPAPRQHFQALNITGGRGVDGITEATQALWKEGVRVSFWLHHSLQMPQYTHLILPPHQFAKTRHGVEIRAPTADRTANQNLNVEAEKEKGLWTFVGYEDNSGALHAQDKHNRGRPRFQINTESEKYKSQVEGHVMARTAAICPAGLEFDMAIEALYSLHPEWTAKRLQPMLVDMVNSAPVCLDSSRTFWLQLSAVDETRKVWDWSITSKSQGASDLLHVKGGIHIRSPDDASYRAEFGRLERLVSHRQCTSLLALAGASLDSSDEEEIHALQGRNVYQGFSDVIQYTDLYRSLRQLVGRGNESAGRVLRKRSHETWLDVPLSECFMQTGGIWVSCMTDRSPDDVFIATGCELWMRSPALAAAKENKEEGPDVWHVLARHHKVSDKVYVTDCFVFDSRTGALTEVIMGTRFSRLPKMVMRKLLAKFTPGLVPNSGHESNAVVEREWQPSRPQSIEIPRAVEHQKWKPAQQPDIAEQVRQLLFSVSGIEPAKIATDAALADLGVDSLMAMELAREIEGVFKFSPDQNDLLEATTVQELTRYISTLLHGSSAASIDGVDSNDDFTGESDPSTPTEASSTDAFHEPIIASSRASEILALQGGDYDVPKLQKPLPKQEVADRAEIAEQYVARYSAGFLSPTSVLTPNSNDQINGTNHSGAVVILTGATGSLGAHLAAGFAQNPLVRTVVCLNRRSNIPGSVRQKEALSTRMLILTEAENAKLRMLDGSTAEPQLGLSTGDYNWLAENATHIVHNAWPMSLNRPIHTFVPQFQAMRNLLDLAREMASNQRAGSNGLRIGFQFVSSISVVGSADEQRVLEQRVPLQTTLPLGYPEAKWVCERMLDETLHRYPDYFRPMVVRPGQITGSHSMGVWNPHEHMPMLVKSAQSLQAWPDLDGPLHWVPVDTVAGTMVDLLLPEVRDKATGLEPDAYPVYHIDNPVGQPWKEMSAILAKALEIPSDRIIPYKEWIELLRHSPLNRERDIPALKILEFFTASFEHMACGGLILDTRLSEEHSRTMAAQGPVSPELVMSYVQSWKRMGFLKS